MKRPSYNTTTTALNFLAKKNAYAVLSLKSSLNLLLKHMSSGIKVFTAPLLTTTKENDSNRESGHQFLFLFKDISVVN